MNVELEKKNQLQKKLIKTLNIFNLSKRKI